LSEVGLYLAAAGVAPLYVSIKELSKAAMVFAMAYPEPPSAKERGQQGQPYEPDAVFFSVVCGFTRADSPHA
jgi:hypothetical protein